MTSNRQFDCLIERIMKQKYFLPRRRFIKTFTFVTAYSSLFGKAWTSILAAEISAAAASTAGTLRLNLQDFPVLLNESGSVRLGINALRGSPPNGPMPDGQFYPVIINRGANDTFYALSSRCTHQGCVVDPLDSSTDQINCPCHGSAYAIDGKRVSGPAPSSLTRYTVTFDGQNELEVRIPNLGYSIVGSIVQPAGNGSPRFRLDFRARRNVEYEVQFHESLDKDPTAVPFSTTLDGAIGDTVFTVASDSNVSLFVERNSPVGIYEVAVRVTEI
jgi:Rieske Fe-S protein